MTGTLLLDQSYMPLSVISWQRAITLLTLDKIEIIEEYDDRELRSRTWVIKMPAVVRLVRAFRRHKKKVKFSRTNILARDGWKCQYCLAPDHKVLTRNFQWVALGNLSSGDQLIGFNEHTPGKNLRRSYQDTTVQSHHFATEETWLVTLADGTQFTVTRDHLWLAKTNQKTSLQWYATHQLEGKFVPRLFNLWNREYTYDAGWLAGLFDGEGWVRSQGGLQISVAQNPGPVLNQATSLLQQRGFTFTTSKIEDKSECQRILITGGVTEQARLLGQIKPQRLIDTLQIEHLGVVKSNDYQKVTSVQHIGRREIVKMATSTGTLIVDGFPHHNCKCKLTTESVTYDHVVPKSQGGKTSWENIVAACGPCNSKKADKTPERAGMKLTKRPVMPSWVPVFTINTSAGSVPEQWASYLYWMSELEK